MTGHKSTPCHIQVLWLLASSGHWRTNNRAYSFPSTQEVYHYQYTGWSGKNVFISEAFSVLIPPPKGFGSNLTLTGSRSRPICHEKFPSILRRFFFHSSAHSHNCQVLLINSFYIKLCIEWIYRICMETGVCLKVLC